MLTVQVHCVGVLFSLKPYPRFIFSIHGEAPYTYPSFRESRAAIVIDRQLFTLTRLYKKTLSQPFKIVVELFIETTKFCETMLGCFIKHRQLLLSMGYNSMGFY